MSRNAVEESLFGVGAVAHSNVVIPKLGAFQPSEESLFDCRDNRRINHLAPRAAPLPRI